MTFDVIASGSTGNAVTVNDGKILLDCGIPYNHLRPHVNRLSLVLLTHEHGDHFHASAVRALHRERPALRWGCCEWMVRHLLDSGVDKRVIDVYDPDAGVGYEYAGVDLTVRPVRLVHNAPNCGYKLTIGNERVFFATDTGTLDGIEAKNYDLYLIEANHIRAELEERIREKEAAGEYAYERQAARHHLSQEQALDWIAENMGPKSRYVFLHQHRQKNLTDTEQKNVDGERPS